MQMNGICRICSSQGEYNIFSVIPSYLHATSNEFLHWKKDISVLLEETTGLTITPNDGLPDKICALCISYLKHAATFRQQAIENVINLKTIQHLFLEYDNKKKQDKIIDSNDNDDETIMITEENLNFRTTRSADTANFISNILNRRVTNNDYVNQNFFNNQNQNRKLDKNSCLEINMNSLNFNNKDYNINLKKSTVKRSYANNRLSTNKELCNFQQKNGCGDLEGLIGSGINGENNSSSGDEMELWNCEESHQKSNKVNFFDYTEKIFEEDDIMELDALKDAKIFNIPINCKERKCRACYRRYMTEETFDNHEKMCLELKFLCLIEELNRLVDIRRSKTISPHEFIRRMIFSLRRTNQWLNSIDISGEKDESVSISNNNRIISNNCGTSNNKNIITNNIFDKIINNDDEKPKTNENLDNTRDIINPPHFFTTTSQSQRDQIKIDNSRDSSKCNIEKNKHYVDDNDPLLKLLREEHENNSLDILNRSLQSNMSNSNVQTIKPLTLSCSTLEQDIISAQHPIENSSTATVNTNKFFSQFTSTMNTSSTSIPHSTPIMIHSPNISKLYHLKHYYQNDNINDLEENAKRKNIIDLFEENTNRNEGIVDLMNILNLEAKKSD